VCLFLLLTATLGVEVHPLTFHTNRGPIQFNVWDTAGQEKYRTITSSFYQHCQGAILLFDVCNETTFEVLNEWLIEARRYGLTDVGGQEWMNVIGMMNLKRLSKTGGL